MNSESTPQLRLILDHEAKNSDSGNLESSWSPCDELCGCLELSNAEPSAIEEISIYFEGKDTSIMSHIAIKFIQVFREIGLAN